MPVYIYRMLDERLAILLSRKLSGEASADELTELNALLKNNPSEEYFVSLLNSYWGGYAPEPLFDHDTHFTEIIATAGQKIEPFKPNKLNRLVVKIAIAAGFIGLIIFGYYIFNRDANSNSDNEREVAAISGSKSFITLPDGSMVWLNSDSRIFYDKGFDKNIREVRLEGEAYFDVKKDTAHPFIVHTNEIDIKVLGTAFNVKSYPSDKTIEATLIRGVVEITNKLDPLSPKILLKPLEKFVAIKEVYDIEKTAQVPHHIVTEINKKIPIVSFSPLNEKVVDSTFIETSWMYNRLQFDGDSFEELARKMQRWYNVQIIFKDNSLSQSRFTGVFEDETIDQALKALQMIKPFKYKIKKNVVEISK